MSPLRVRLPQERGEEVWHCGEGRRAASIDAIRAAKHGDPPLPGIDISNSAALQEMDDLEYVERLKNGFK